MIELHYTPTPNGFKIAIMLEELGIPYRVIPYDIFNGDHLAPEFRDLNPNQKVPVLVDREGEEPIAIFESGAILLYLAEKYGRFLPKDRADRSAVIQWLMWQMAGLGPMAGQAHHFVRYAPEGETYGVSRYVNECRRIMGVLEYRLSTVEYLAGEYSVADIASWPWVQGMSLLGIDQADYPAVDRWSQRIAERPAIRAVAASQELRMPDHYVRARMKLSEEQWSKLFSHGRPAPAAE